MDEYESLIQRKPTQKTEDAEPIDSDKQQEIIDNLTKEYNIMVRNERIQIIVVSSVFCLVHIIIFAMMHTKLNFLLNMAPYACILASQFVEQPILRYLSIAFEAAAALFEYVSPVDLRRPIIILLHVATILIVWYTVKAAEFVQQTPKQIADLAKKKYDYKIA